MKKSIIAAGAASAVLAAMPVVGVFADPAPVTLGTPVVDTLSVNLAEVCTLSRGTYGTENSQHPAGTTATWTTGTVTSEDSSAETVQIAGVNVPLGVSRDTASSDIVAGHYYNNFAQSAFNVVCNNATAGYNVTVATSAFTGVNGADAWNYSNGGANYSGTDGEATTSSWTLDSSAATKDLSNTDATTETFNIVWAKAAGTPALNNDSFTITYKVQAKKLQQTGTYSADAVYTLASI